MTFHDIFSGLILGTGAPGATSSDDTVGGVLNLIYTDGVPAYVPYAASWAGTSAFPHSDLFGHEVTARITDFPSQYSPPRSNWPWRRR
ncbi:MAG TPA: hypothetical protein VME22_27980 [Solirubrobacteraceae bacterium]|nr:hypothetical protein [Solirubrobacteraceae bacterium]